MREMIKQDQRNGYGLETDYILADESQERRGRFNTLAHYMSIHDDLYCQIIYQNFAIKPENHSVSEKAKYDAIQAYLRDGCRILNLKIYKVKLYTNDEVGWSDPVDERSAHHHQQQSSGRIGLDQDTANEETKQQN